MMRKFAFPTGHKGQLEPLMGKLLLPTGLFLSLGYIRKQANQLKREALLRRITQSAHSSLKIEEIFQTIVDGLNEYLDADRCFISRYNHEEKQLTPPSVEARSSDDITSMLGPNPDLWNAMSQVSQSIFQAEKPVYLDIHSSQLPPDTRSCLEKLKVQTGIGSAIHYHHKALAILFIQRVKKRQGWSQSERELMTEISDQIGAAIHQADIYHQEQEMKEAAQKAEKAAEVANQRKSQFLSNMSHELRTPLNAVIGYSEMLEIGMAGELNPRQKTYAHNVVVSSHHLLDMVNDILDIAKIEAGQLTISPRWLELEPLFNEVEAVVQEIARQKNVTINHTLKPGIDGIEADPSRLRQIFYNLISNAIKFNKEGGNVDITISKSQDGQWIICKVEDTGIGMPQERMPELFSEFYQIDSSPSRHQEGTGLGLALTKRLVELHGGVISAESQEGVGSTFIFKLPIHIPKNHDAATPAEKSIV